MIQHMHVKAYPVDENEKQAAAANTARLRELRLAKEAADRETGSGQATPMIKKSGASRIGPPTRRAS
jgi:hypothetical protein